MLWFHQIQVFLCCQLHKKKNPEPAIQIIMWWKVMWFFEGPKGVNCTDRTSNVASSVNIKEFSFYVVAKNKSHGLEAFTGKLRTSWSSLCVWTWILCVKYLTIPSLDKNVWYYWNIVMHIPLAQLWRRRGVCLTRVVSVFAFLQPRSWFTWWAAARLM